jgi:predicted phage terminase large subunit-like protein
MDTEFYRAIFPSTMIPGHNADDFEGKYKRNAREFSVVGREGSYRCAGVGGPITGFPADLFILDDLIKNRSEADSFVVREKVWNWMTSTARTRINQDGAIVLLMTRWHQDDPVGRIEEFMKTVPDFDQYEIFNFPAIAEPMSKNPYDSRVAGEPLWPLRYNLEYLASTKASSGVRDWNALYQGNPVSAAGSVFKRSWFKFYKELPSAVTHHLTSWDLSFEDKATSSYTVGQYWCREKANLYIIDQVRDLLDFPGQKQAVRTFTAKHPKAFEKIVEKKANGAALLAELKNDIPGMVPIEPHGSKLDRAKAASVSVEAGNVWLPSPDIAPWVHDLIEELCAFPTGRYNDQVDTFSQAILRYRQGGSGEFTKDLVPKPRHGTFATRTRVERKW